MQMSQLELLEIIKSDELKCTNEDQVLDFVLSYIYKDR